MRVLVVLAIALVPALTGCGGGASERVSDAPATQLVVEVRADAVVAATRLSLVCDPPSGDHPDPPAACADLAREQQPFAPLPTDQACTEIYGGPQTATVRGTYRGEPVRLDLARTDGCRIAQWDRLGALLPPVPEAPGEPVPS